MEKTVREDGFISTSNPSRETLGTQILRESQKRAYTQDAGETVAEMGHMILSELERSIKNTRDKGIRGKIYIHILEQKIGQNLGRPVVKYIFYIRRTRPTPEWNTILYSHDDEDSQPTFEYSLPELVHVPGILTRSWKFPPKYVEFINSMLKGELR